MKALRVLGGLNLVLAGFMTFPLLVALLYKEDPLPFLITIPLCGLAGGGMYYVSRGVQGELSQREAFWIVSLSWADASFFGALPLYFAGFGFVDALFETISGFTTTGATVLGEIEVWPKGVLFWRAMTQWLGGMGIIVFSVAILPFLGVGGMQLFKAEVPGPMVEKLRPRIAQTAKLLWTLYFVLSAAEAFLLFIGGMSPYESLCHTFTTMSTGGFSTRTSSLGAFSPYHQLVVMAFMILAGANFSLHWRFVSNRKVHLRDPEFRLYLALLALGTVVVSWDLIRHVGGGLLSVKDAAFQVISILTTTGYSTADFGSWPPLCQLILLFLMFVGGCAGSTAGGIKVVRLLIFSRFISEELKRLLWPKAVTAIRVGERVVGNEVVNGVLALGTLYLGLFALSSLVLAAAGRDLVTALSAVAACLGNVGPGLGKVGPALNYGFLTPVEKGTLMFCMLAGRLEVYSLVILLFPAFWRK